MHPIIALWCHPRSMSTAIERIMRERGDCICFHEPFLPDYYVARRVRPLPHFEPDSAQPTSYEPIRDSLLEAAERGPVFFKDMSYYVVPRLFEDRDFAGRVTHSFLVRNLVHAILSYYKLDPAVTCEEIGLEAQWRQFQWLEETFGTAPAVLQAEEVQRAPSVVLAAYWARIGLPYRDAFAWDSGKAPDDWGSVSGWHGSVANSQTIRSKSLKEDDRRQAEFEVVRTQSPQLKAFLDHHRPSYEALRARSLQVG